MKTKSNIGSLKFAHLAIYPQQREYYESCLCLYSVKHEINDAENNMNNVCSLSMCET